MCKLSKGLLFTRKWDKNAISETYTSKDTLLNPQKAAKQFVEERIVAVLKSKLLPIYGNEMSSDILFNFIDRYSSILGVEPYLGCYSVQDLSIALNRHLFKISESLIRRRFLS